MGRKSKNSWKHLTVARLLSLNITEYKAYSGELTHQIYLPIVHLLAALDRLTAYASLSGRSNSINWKRELKIRYNSRKEFKKKSAEFERNVSSDVKLNSRPHTNIFLL